MMTAERQILTRWGTAIREARKAADGMTQEELAALTESSQPTISAIENGEHRPSLKLQLAIAKALNSSYDALFAVGEGVA